MLASFQGSMTSYLKKASNVLGQSCGHRTPGWQVLVLPCKLPCTFGEGLCSPRWYLFLQILTYLLLPQRSLFLESNRALPGVGAYAFLPAERLNLCIVGCCFPSALDFWHNFLRGSPRPHCRLLTALPSAPATLICYFYILRSTSFYL